MGISSKQAKRLWKGKRDKMLNAPGRIEKVIAARKARLKPLTDSQRRYLDKIPVHELNKYMIDRKRKDRSSGDRWASQRKLSLCPGCEQLFGVRQMQMHRKDCLVQAMIGSSEVRRNEK